MKNSHLSLCHLTSFLMFCGALSPLAHSANIPESQMPEILLAQNYVAGMNPAAYYVSEKLDGVRAVWDGKVLRFRSGKVINAPAWFTANFPDHRLDGELWIGRHKFDEVSAATRRLIPIDDEWKEITYQVYELPNGFGSFEDRLVTMKLSVDKANVSWLNVLQQFSVTDENELQSTLKEYVQSGGEGLMLHRRDALWQTGRSDVLLKLKMFLDAEAKVIAHEPGKGKYQGMLGALLLEMPDGIRFSLGTGFSDEQRRFPPEVGSVVTYRYRDLTPQGVPKFANFLRVRVDD
jgi:DNA ligase-1